jgi:DMSO/TMAO reductase YedYZ heme-binding membrane subunit
MLVRPNGEVERTAATARAILVPSEPPHCHPPPITDIVKRKFIFFGFSTFVLLIPLAATSTNAAFRRLGYVRWKQLHRLAYLAPALAVLHFIWRVKLDVREPVAYGLVLAALLSVRLVDYLHDRKALLMRQI